MLNISQNVRDVIEHNIDLLETYKFKEFFKNVQDKIDGEELRLLLELIASIDLEFKDRLLDYIRFLFTDVRKISVKDFLIVDAAEEDEILYVFSNDKLAPSLINLILLIQGPYTSISEWEDLCILVPIRDSHTYNTDIDIDQDNKLIHTLLAVGFCLSALPINETLTLFKDCTLVVDEFYEDEYSFLLMEYDIETAAASAIKDWIELFINEVKGVIAHIIH